MRLKKISITFIAVIVGVVIIAINLGVVLVTNKSSSILPQFDHSSLEKLITEKEFNNIANKENTWLSEDECTIGETAKYQGYNVVNYVSVSSDDGVSFPASVDGLMRVIYFTSDETNKDNNRYNYYKTKEEAEEKASEYFKKAVEQANTKWGQDNHPDDHYGSWLINDIDQYRIEYNSGDRTFRITEYID